MKHQQPLTTATLFTLAILSIAGGMLLFELLLYANSLPAWTLLIEFFALGILGKFLHYWHHLPQPVAQRVVTIEFDITRFSQENYAYGH